MPSFGKILIGLGLLITAVGLVGLFLERSNIPMGTLPGDIVYKSKDVNVYLPLTTCIVISIVISVVFWILNRR
ncbi:MAG: hypothetical protein JWO13_235 [Acidobacteriales bacterium]|nr:hypothetical protein [Terriglobales bacterium]